MPGTLTSNTYFAIRGALLIINIVGMFTSANFDNALAFIY